jgi:hypothetical protein
MSDNDPDLMNHPEGSYRRGYQQGAFDALEALQAMPKDKVEDWINSTLATWRFDQLDNRKSPPRPWLKRRSMVQPWQPRV